MTGQQDALSQTLARRLRDISRVLDRLDRLEAGSGSWLAQQNESDLQNAAQEMTLRAVRQAADSHNFALLKLLHTDRITYPVGELQNASGLDRMTLSERLNDLVQVGLVVREIDTDHVQITDAGRSLTGWLSNIQQTVTHALTEQLHDGKKG